MPYPAKFGQPCWDERQVGKVLSITAQTNEQSTDAFIAAHSPFRFVTNARDPRSRELSEEDVFEAILRRHGEVQAAVKGEPGTGKSHLVHWLKLRADFEAEHGDARYGKLVRVLVQRGNGSLKDALRQIVERLGEGFRKHLRQLEGAIDKMSAENARATLLAELGLEISPRWGNERVNRPPFPKKLKLLAPALRSEGVQRWLLRQGSVIDQIVRRLTEGASPAEQESWPTFTPDELSPPPGYLSLAETSEDVREFFLTDLPMEPMLREQAAEALNIARADAVASLTGLSGLGLREIFDNIRRDLFKQGRELALFIEDVSVTGLDREIVNALEPQSRDKLCRMVAVIGITSNAWEPLPENQKGRFDPIFEVGAGVTARWSSDADEVAHFTARYLNAIRSTDGEIAAMASARRVRGGELDVPVSKCDGCPQREPCHLAFGRVTLPGKVEIGLFPFTPRAPQALLSGLSEDTERTGVRRSQRGLIENVLIPVLQGSRSALESEQFPRPASLPVRMTVPRFWTGFTHTYLGGGGWDSNNKDRLQLLAEYWAESSDADELAASLQPLLAPLGLPDFVHGPRTGRATDKNVEPKPEQKPRAENQPVVSPELQRKLQALENWSRGETLKGDSDFRDLLKDLFQRSIPWPNQRDLPIAEARRIVDTNKFPRIEDQVSNPIGQPRVYLLSRDAEGETRALIEALVQFSIAGRNSWNFEHGELHKRKVWRWLRKHRAEVVGTVMPEAPVSPREAVTAATRVLAIAAILRDRQPLPKDNEERIARLLAPVWNEENRPVAFASPMRELVDDLEQRHAKLRDFVLSELGAGQGQAPPKDYLDPLPLLDALRDAGEDVPKLPALAAQFHEGYWQKRFLALRGISEFSDLPARLDAERAKASEIVAQLRTILEECGAKVGQDMRAGFEAWLVDFAELVDVQRGSGKVRRFKLDVWNPPFEAVWNAHHFQTQPQREKLAVALGRAGALAQATSDEVRWLTFDPKPLIDLERILVIAQEHLRKIDKLVTEMEDHHTASGGGDRDALIAELDALATPTGFQSAPAASTHEENDEPK